MPTVGTFSQDEPSEFSLDEETKLKVIGSTPVEIDCELPEHVNVLFVKTLEDVELSSETTAGLKQLHYDHR